MHVEDKHHSDQMLPKQINSTSKPSALPLPSNALLFKVLIPLTERKMFLLATLPKLIPTTEAMTTTKTCGVSSVVSKEWLIPGVRLVLTFPSLLSPETFSVTRQNHTNCAQLENWFWDASQTRWLEKLNTVDLFLTLYKAILETMDLIRTNENKHEDADSIEN